MAETRLEDEDPILPVRITHNCERIWNGDSLEQEYNYLVYEFSTEQGSYTARTYLDTIHQVSIYGPSKIDERVLAYLRRRFTKLQRFGRGGYEPIK